MKKKGMAMATILSFVLGLAILIIVLLIFFGPEALYEKAKESFPTVNIFNTKRSNDLKTDYDTRPVQDQARSVYNDVLNGFTSLSNDQEQACFYILDNSLPFASLEDYWIKIKKSDDQTIFYLIDPLEDANDEIAAEVEHSYVVARVPNVKPCIVGTKKNEELQSQKFYDYWISLNNGAAWKVILDMNENKDVHHNPPGNDHISVNEIILQHDKIVYDGVEQEWLQPDDQQTNNLVNPGYFLYKNGDEICFIPTINRDKCKVTKKGILSNACFETGQGSPGSLMDVIDTRNYYPIHNLGGCNPLDNFFPEEGDTS